MRRAGVPMRSVFSVLEVHAVAFAKTHAAALADGVKPKPKVAQLPVRRTAAPTSAFLVNGGGNGQQPHEQPVLKAELSVSSTVDLPTPFQLEVMRLAVSAEIASRTLKWLHRLECNAARAKALLGASPGKNTTVSLTDFPLVSTATLHAEMLNRLLYENTTPTYEAWPLQTCVAAYLKFGQPSAALRSKLIIGEKGARKAMFDDALAHGIRRTFAWVLAPARDKPVAPPEETAPPLVTAGELENVVGFAMTPWHARAVTTAAAVVSGSRRFSSHDLSRQFVRRLRFSGDPDFVDSAPSGEESLGRFVVEDAASAADDVVLCTARTSSDVKLGPAAVDVASLGFRENRRELPANLEMEKRLEATAGLVPALDKVRKAKHGFAAEALLLAWFARLRTSKMNDAIVRTVPGSVPSVSWHELVISGAAACRVPAVGWWLQLAGSLTKGTALSTAATTRFCSELLRAPCRHLADVITNIGAARCVASHTNDATEKARLLLAALERTSATGGFADIDELLSPTNALYHTRHVAHAAACASLSLCCGVPDASVSLRQVLTGVDVLAASVRGPLAKMRSTASHHRVAGLSGWHDTLLVHALRSVTRAIIQAVVAAEQHESPKLDETLTELARLVVRDGICAESVYLTKSQFGDDDPQTAVALSNFACIELYARREKLSAKQLTVMRNMCTTVAKDTSKLTTTEMKTFVKHGAFAAQLAAVGDVMLQTGQFEEQEFLVKIATQLLREDEQDPRTATRNRAMAEMLERRMMTETNAILIQATLRQTVWKQPKRVSKRFYYTHHAYVAGLEFCFCGGWYKLARHELEQRENITRNVLTDDALSFTAEHGTAFQLLRLLQAEYDLHKRRLPYMELYAAEAASKAADEAALDVYADETDGRYSIIREALLGYAGEMRAAFVRERLFVRNLNRHQRTVALPTVQARIQRAMMIRQRREDDLPPPVERPSSPPLHHEEPLWHPPQPQQHPPQRQQPQHPQHHLPPLGRELRIPDDL
jgi:hypothetical protein